MWILSWYKDPLSESTSKADLEQIMKLDKDKHWPLIANPESAIAILEFHPIFRTNT